MTGVHVYSGSLVMTQEHKVRIDHGPLQVKFSNDGELDTQADFLVTVDFNQNVGTISPHTIGTQGEKGNFRLFALAVSGGAHGEIVSLTYSIYQLS